MPLHVTFGQICVFFYLINANIAVNSIVKAIYYYFDNGSSGKNCLRVGGLTHWQNVGRSARLCQCVMVF